MLEARTPFDRLEARGTMRIALKGAGLDSKSVDATQMAVVLRAMLPPELTTRGVTDVARVCDSIAEATADIAVDASEDRAGNAAATMHRLGS